MNAKALEATAATWARLLAVALILVALALVGGAACGGDEDDRDSRPTSRPSEERESTGDSEEQEEDDSESPSTGLLGGAASGSSEDVDARGDEIRENNEARSSSRSGSVGADAGVSIENLESIPNLNYSQLMLIDANAYSSGEIPREIIETADSKYYLGNLLSFFSDSLAGNAEENQGSPASDVTTLAHLDWDRDDNTGGVKWLVIQEVQDQEALRNAINASAMLESIAEIDLELELWQFDDQLTLALIEDRVVFLPDDLQDSLELLEPIANSDSLLNNPDNSMIRAMERAGSGWLLMGMRGPDRCDRFGSIDIDPASCLGMAISAYTGSDSTVEGTWVVLMDIEESAEELVSAIRSVKKDDPNDWPYRDMHNIAIDGEFVVVQSTLPEEEAIRFIGR